VDHERDFDGAADFHGYRCPEIALGVRFVIAARSHLAAAANAPMFIHSEGSGCLVDALQHLTGATIGNRRLTPYNYGKLAAVFWYAGAAQGLRIWASAGSPAYAEQAALQPHHSPGSPDADREFIQQTITTILDAAPEGLLEFEEVPVPPIEETPLAQFEPCTRCTELLRRNRLFNHDGVKMCDQCHLASHGGALPAIHPRDPLPS
jgi:formylmethanofuran dehydrogenase subunit E